MIQTLRNGQQMSSLPQETLSELLTFELKNHKIDVRGTGTQAGSTVTLCSVINPPQKKSPLFETHFWPCLNASINIQQLPHEMDPLLFTSLAMWYLW